MAFLPASGKVQCEAFPKTASAAIACGAVLEADGSGAVNPADAADLNLFGISMKTIASTDADFASTTPIPVIMLNAETEFFMDVGTGTATAALVGTKCDLKDSISIDVTATAHNQVTITGFISGTLVKGRFNGSYLYRPAV